jgi:hypothetical protein
VDTGGRAAYEEPCPGVPGCTLYYYSRATGCSYDYDTRGWTVEPGYTALLFDHFDSPQYPAVMRFLLSLEDQGTFPDLWGYWPPPEDPEYPWTIADTSVVNMSIIFWSMTSILTGRAERSWAAGMCEPEAIGLSSGALPWPRPGGLVLGGGVRDPGLLPALRATAVVPNPAREACELRFTLARKARVSLGIYDVSGRRLRDLVSGSLDAGEHAVGWDLRDADGSPCRAGIYIAEVRVDGPARSMRIVVSR